MNQSERGRIIEFVERNLIGRTVSSEPVTTSTSDGRIEASYIDQNFFSNLVRSDFGFSFDLTDVTIGRRYTVDEKGQAAELAGSLDAVRVYRYDMTERPSSGRVVGFARFISSTNTEFDPLVGTCFLVHMRLEDETLVVEENQVAYGDFIAPGGERRPVASDSFYRYSVRDGRLVVEFQQTTFNVDPETLERSPTEDRFPPKVSEEFGEPG
jgi:hypothetical protein